ncbi:MAG: amidohydrolase family protein [Oceanospirillaceae bacterium]
MVIGHCAKPAVAQGEFDQWTVDMQELAAHSHCYCKISGLITEAIVNWKITDLQPYMTHLLDFFTHQRLIQESDWPVLNLASDYSLWLATSET